MFKNFATYIARSILKKGQERKRAIAMLRGYFWGFRWMFNKKPNNGYNPYKK